MNNGTDRHELRYQHGQQSPAGRRGSAANLMTVPRLRNLQQLVCRQYRSCVDALRDELGVSPGEETVQLFHDLTAAV